MCEILHFRIWGSHWRVEYIRRLVECVEHKDYQATIIQMRRTFMLLWLITRERFARSNLPSISLSIDIIRNTNFQFFSAICCCCGGKKKSNNFLYTDFKTTEKLGRFPNLTNVAYKLRLFLHNVYLYFHHSVHLLWLTIDETRV
jgi:hypothetical protein